MLRTAPRCSAMWMAFAVVPVVSVMWTTLITVTPGVNVASVNTQPGPNAAVLNVASAPVTVPPLFAATARK